MSTKTDRNDSLVVKTAFTPFQKATLLSFNSVITSKQASSFFNNNLTNADNDNSMNMSTRMEMSQVNKPANKVQTMQYDTNIQTHLLIHLVGRDKLITNVEEH